MIFASTTFIFLKEETRLNRREKLPFQTDNSVTGADVTLNVQTYPNAYPDTYLLIGKPITLDKTKKEGRLEF